MSTREQADRERGQADDTREQADEEREKVLVSACLLGAECRYDGRANTDNALARDLAARDLQPVPFCPEEHGGLGTPRPPAWIEHTSAADVLDGRDRVITDTSVDVTTQFKAGAQGALDTCRAHNIHRAFLKERSPSCGTCNTHAANQLVQGPGVTTELLRRNGIEVVPVEGRRESSSPTITAASTSISPTETV